VCHILHKSFTPIFTGTTVTLFMSRPASYAYDQRCEIFGNDGLVSIQNIYHNSTVVSSAAGIQHSRLRHSFPERFNQAFALELDSFADTVLEGKPWPVTREQCIRAQRVADAARLSAETGNVIKVEPYISKITSLATDEAVAAAL
jgi:myo-inositol 2-dehydrogenase/D-chiro-inositol 1-dehydrogenase